VSPSVTPFFFSGVFPPLLTPSDFFFYGIPVLSVPNLAVGDFSGLDPPFPMHRGFFFPPGGVAFDLWGKSFFVDGFLELWDPPDVFIYRRHSLSAGGFFSLFLPRLFGFSFFVSSSASVPFVHQISHTFPSSPKMGVNLWPLVRSFFRVLKAYYPFFSLFRVVSRAPAFFPFRTPSLLPFAFPV